MIRREYDPALINAISNMSGVAENVSYKDGPMDWASAFPASATGIIILSNGEDACAVFGMTDVRRWQVHTMFGPSCRGRKALDAGNAMIDYMRPAANVLWGATPISNCAARWFNRQLGAMPIRRDHFEAEGEVEIFEIRI